MANVTNTNLSYSPVESESQIKIPNLETNTATDFATVKSGAGERIISNTKNTDGGVYTLRYAMSDVKNVFTGSDVDPALYGAVKKGKNLLVKVRHTGTKEEDGRTIHYPVECGVTFKYPVNVVNENDLLQLFEEALNAVLQPKYGTSEAEADIRSNLAKLMRGAFPNV